MFVECLIHRHICEPLERDASDSFESVCSVSNKVILDMTLFIPYKIFYIVKHDPTLFSFILFLPGCVKFL